MLRMETNVVCFNFVIIQCCVTGGWVTRYLFELLQDKLRKNWGNDFFPSFQLLWFLWQPLESSHCTYIRNNYGNEERLTDIQWQLIWLTFHSKRNFFFAVPLKAYSYAPSTINEISVIFYDEHFFVAFKWLWFRPLLVLCTRNTFFPPSNPTHTHTQNEKVS